MRGATAHPEATLFQSNAPRAGCDFAPNVAIAAEQHFNLMHPVRGATAVMITSANRGIYFNLMHPVRGATAKLYNSSVSWQHVGCTVLLIMCFTY